MASEKYINRGRTTLGQSINSAATSIVVADGDVFPSAGQFRVTIEDEIILVTARSSNTLTVTRARESTTAASHWTGFFCLGRDVLGKSITPISPTVALLITKGTLDQIIADNCQRGTIANKPSAEKAGRLYLATDSPLIFRDNGSTWDAFGPVAPIYPADPAIFTHFTGGSGTITKSTVAPFTVTISGSSFPTANHAVIAAPATPYEITMLLDVGFGGFNNSEWQIGPGFYNNSGSLIITNWVICFSASAMKLRQLRWQSYSAPDLQDVTWDQFLFMQPWGWFKVKDDGTNLSVFVSPNGFDWAALSVQARAARVGTPTHVGVVCECGTTSNVPVTCRILSWVQQ